MYWQTEKIKEREQVETRVAGSSRVRAKSANKAHKSIQFASFDEVAEFEEPFERVQVDRFASPGKY